MTTLDRIFALVDELANIATPTPASGIVRLGLVTELRNELRPSIGGNNRGGGTASSILIDTAILTLWEDVTARIQTLPEELGDGHATTGSLEQILNRWARDLAVADATTGTSTAPGLNPDALDYHLHRLERIRDLIDEHFNPPERRRLQQCPECLATHVTLNQDGHDSQDRAVLLTRYPHNPDRPAQAICRVCGTTWTGADRIAALNDALNTLANDRKSDA